MSDKTARRLQREQAVKGFNALASEFEEDTLKVRAAGEEVTELYGRLGALMPDERRGELEQLQQQWQDNGGLGNFPAFAAESSPQSGPVPSHAHIAAVAGKAFRLHSKAFMLTFNSLVFQESEEFWNSFQKWVETKAHEFQATYWSATVEESEHSEDQGRVHCHCYLSWHGPGAKGVDHRTTDAFVFDSVRPRVDCNSEHRGPYYWLKATQHGHFYTSVFKMGTYYAATNYAPWTGIWVPEEHWIKSLWKQHKLSHEMYIALSIRFRDGHDRRRACVEAVISGELSQSYVQEKAAARLLLEKSVKPFKPLPDAIQTWKLQYDEPLERYKMLVLFGPSCTGKSRLARSLFGVSDTLVVDVQHAEHPDLRGYRRSVHKAVLLDEVSSPKFLVANKKVLQAHVDGAILGQSATQLYTYEVFLWRTPLMLTTNNFDYSGFSLSDVNWIETNAVAVFVGEPVWELSAIVPPASPKMKPDGRRAWGSPVHSPGGPSVKRLR